MSGGDAVVGSQWSVVSGRSIQATDSLATGLLVAWRTGQLRTRVDGTYAIHVLLVERMTDSAGRNLGVHNGIGVAPVAEDKPVA